MLQKRDPAEAEQASEPVEPEPIQITKLIKQTGGKLAGLAGVSSSKQDQFLRQVSKALMQWLCIILQSGNVDPCVPDQLLGEAQRKQGALHRQQEALRRQISRSAGYSAEDFRKIANFERRRADFERRLAIIQCLVDATRALTDPRRAPRYPGLNSLVSGLESAARRAGGKFTAHRKVGKKGTLIKALDEIRNCLCNEEDMCGRFLAETLPKPDQHPVATYEHLLHAARKA